MRILGLHLALAAACLALPQTARSQQQTPARSPTPYDSGVIIDYPPARTTPGPPAHATLSSQSPRPREVAIYDDYFSPPLLMVRTGTVVRWKNRGRHTHTVTFANASPKVDSGALAPGAEFSVTCTSPGVFRYSCTMHGGKMSGTLYVYSEFYMPEMDNPGRRGRSRGSRGY